MRCRLGNGCFGTFLVLSLIAAVHGEEPRPAPAPRVIERFTVSGDGDELLVPVRVKGKEYLFALDTGSTITVYDQAIPLGEPRATVAADSPGGKVKVKVFDAPNATLGRLRLPEDSLVAGMDLSTMREVGGHPIYGIVGMDFLRNHVVQIDFDRGEVLLLKSVLQEADTVEPLSFRRGWPYVTARVAGSGYETFIVDTGAVGFGCGCGDLTPTVFGELLDKRRARVVGAELSASISGTRATRILELEAFSLGGLRLDRPSFGEAKQNLLGLGYWSRFMVTFDFPGERVYLQKGKAFGRPYRRDLSGLHLVRRDGKTLVDSVNAGSPAAASGIKAGDTLVKVGGQRAGALRLFELRVLFCAVGKTLELTLERGKEERLVSLNLATKR